MAEFLLAYEKMILNEGGYRLHKVENDIGGLTYAGISRKYHQHWPGWELIDRNELENINLTELVRDFYKEKFWNKIKGNELSNQIIASSIFDFAVNAGVHVAVKLAQLVIIETPDGIIGEKSIAGLNEIEESMFVIHYALSKIARYTKICNQNSDQKIFLLGWLNRTLRELKV